MATQAGQGELAGRLALVTGGAQGIGLGIARSLAERGADIALLDIHDDVAAEAAASLRGPAASVMTVAADVRDRAAVRRAVAQVTAEAGPIDILINNAGTVVFKSQGPDFFRFSADDELRRLFADRGLADVEVRTIAFSHRIDACEDLWTAFQRGSVRMAALVLGQSEPTRERIRQGLERRLRDYAAGGGFELPVSVKLAVGRTPID